MSVYSRMDMDRVLRRLELAERCCELARDVVAPWNDSVAARDAVTPALVYALQAHAEAVTEDKGTLKRVWDLDNRTARL